MEALISNTMYCTVHVRNEYVLNSCYRKSEVRADDNIRVGRSIQGGRDCAMLCIMILIIIKI